MDTRLTKNLDGKWAYTSSLRFPHNAVHDHADHSFFFFRAGFRDHDRQCDQRLVIQEFFAELVIQHVVSVQKVQKHRRGNTFVAVQEEYMGGLEAFPLLLSKISTEVSESNSPSLNILPM